MSEYCILVADAERARIFTLEQPAVPEIEAGPRLVEQQVDLINPEDSLPHEERWADPRPGGFAADGHMQGYDDHRGRHIEENRLRFARQIAAQTLRHAIDNHVKCLVVVSERRMLGLLRQSIALPPHSDIKVVEVAKDLARLTPHDIQRHLADEGVIPPQTRPAAG